MLDVDETVVDLDSINRNLKPSETAARVEEVVAILLCLKPD